MDVFFLMVNFFLKMPIIGIYHKFRFPASFIAYLKRMMPIISVDLNEVFQRLAGRLTGGLAKSNALEAYYDIKLVMVDVGQNVSRSALAGGALVRFGDESLAQGVFDSTI